MTEIYTIGYGNRTIDYFTDLLTKYQIEVLVDIRSIPRSRFRPEYNQSRLSKHLAEIGIEYQFKGLELGGKPKNEDLYIDGVVCYDLIRQTELYQQGLEYLKDILKSDRKVCIMCSELDYTDCHRWSLVGIDLFNADIVVIHINKAGELEKTNILL